MWQILSSRKFSIVDMKAHFLKRPTSKLPTVKPVVKTYRRSSIPPPDIGFPLEGLHMVKALMDGAFFSLTISYTFKWNRTGFRIIEFLPQKIACAILMIITMVSFVVRYWGIFNNISSRKEDLLNCFIFIRHISSITTFLSYIYTGVWKKRDFLQLLQHISSKMIACEARVTQRRKQFVAHLLMFLGVTAIFLYGLSSIFEKGVHDAARNMLNSYVDENAQGYPPLKEYYPENGSWSGWICSLVVLTLIFQFNLTFWSYILFDFIFVLFIRCNLKSFKKFLENVTPDQKAQLYEEYLYLKSLVDLVNKYIGPRFFALFFSLISFFSYFLANFTEMGLGRNENRLFFVIWATLIWAIFIVAADTSTLTGDIKRVLMKRKRELDQLCDESSSSVSVMLMDMSSGNELGITCCGSIIVDYGFIGSILGSIFTFAIILIQAKDN